VRPLAKRLKERQKRHEKAANATPSKPKCVPLKRCLGDTLLDCKVATMLVMQVIAMISALLLLALSASQFLSVESLHNGDSINVYPNATFPNSTYTLADACSQNPVLDSHRPARFRVSGSNEDYFVCSWSGKYAVWRLIICILGLLVNPVSIAMAMQGHKFQTYLTLGGKAVVALMLLIVMGVDASQTNNSRQWCLDGAAGLDYSSREGRSLDCDYSPFIATVFFDMSFLIWAVDLGLTFMYANSWMKKSQERRFERMQNEEI